MTTIRISFSPFFPQWKPTQVGAIHVDCQIEISELYTKLIPTPICSKGRGAGDRLRADFSKKG